MFDLQASDWVIAFATLAGPILAVQAQKWVERATAARREKANVFYALMATRSSRLSIQHVQALNRIEVVFGNHFSLLGIRKQNSKDSVVLDRWKEYNAKLSENIGSDPARIPVWASESSNLFIELVHAMSKSVGANIDRAQIARGYNPVAHFEGEATQNAIAQAMLSALTGQSPFRVEVTAMPANEEFIEAYRKTQDRVIGAVATDGSFRVTLTPASVNNTGMTDKPPSP